MHKCHILETETRPQKQCTAILMIFAAAAMHTADRWAQQSQRSKYRDQQDKLSTDKPYGKIRGICGGCKQAKLTETFHMLCTVHYSTVYGRYSHGLTINKELRDREQLST